MKAFRITFAALAAGAVVAPAAIASPLPVEGGDADWAQPRVLETGSAASHYTNAAVAAMGARAQAAAAFYAAKQKATAAHSTTPGAVAAMGARDRAAAAHDAKKKQAKSLSFAELAALVRRYQPEPQHPAASRVRPHGAADIPGKVLDDLYGFGDAAAAVAEPTPAAQLSDDDADAARSQPSRFDEVVIDAFDGYYDMWPTGTDRSPASQPAATPASQSYDDLDAALAAYQEGATDPWLRRVLGLPDAVPVTTSCFSVELQSAPSSQAADPDSDAYAAAKEAFDDGAIDPMLREVLGISGPGRHVFLVHTNDGCSTRSASAASAATATDWRGETNASSGYSPGVAADGIASLYSGNVEPVA